MIVHQSHIYFGYCPIHEFETWQCCNCCDCCALLKRELRRIDNNLRGYWHSKGYWFRDRGRSTWGPRIERHAS